MHTEVTSLGIDPGPAFFCSATSSKSLPRPSFLICKLEVIILTCLYGCWDAKVGSSRLAHSTCSVNLQYQEREASMRMDSQSHPNIPFFHMDDKRFSLAGSSWPKYLDSFRIQLLGTLLCKAFPETYPPHVFSSASWDSSIHSSLHLALSESAALLDLDSLGQGSCVSICVQHLG